MDVAGWVLFLCSVVSVEVGAVGEPVGDGDDGFSGGGGDGEDVGVDHVVVEPAEQDAVVDVGGSSVVVLLDVVGFAGGGGDVAVGEGAGGSVAGDHSGALGAVEGAFLGADRGDTTVGFEVDG